MIRRYLMHHGVEGQRWGVRNGPPYPLNTDQRAVSRMNADYLTSRDAWTRKDNPELASASDTYVNTHIQNHPVEALDDMKRLNGEDQDRFWSALSVNDPDEEGERLYGRYYNCQNSTIAGEMAMRGYDVKARPKLDGSNVGDIASYFKDGKLENLGLKDLHITEDKLYDDVYWEQLYKMRSDIESQVEDSLKTQGPGARGIIVVGQSNLFTYGDADEPLGFHARNYIVDKKGDLRILDCQEGDDYGSILGGDGGDPRDVWVMRTDTLELADNVGEAVYSRPQNKPDPVNEAGTSKKGRSLFFRRA